MHALHPLLFTWPSPNSTSTTEYQLRFQKFHTARSCSRNSRPAIRNSHPVILVIRILVYKYCGNFLVLALYNYSRVIAIYMRNMYWCL
jgi:hypothetical protein